MSFVDFAHYPKVSYYFESRVEIIRLFEFILFFSTLNGTLECGYSIFCKKLIICMGVVFTN